MFWRLQLIYADGLLCLVFPGLARYTIDVHHPITGIVFHMSSVNLRSSRNAAALALSFAEEAKGRGVLRPDYRVRRL